MVVPAEEIIRNSKWVIRVSAIEPERLSIKIKDITIKADNLIVVL